MKLMEDSAAAITCCLHAQKLTGLYVVGLRGGKRHSWTLIEELQFTCCRDVEHGLTASAPGVFAHRNGIECVCLPGCNIDISKQAESDLLDGEERQPGTHRNRQKNRQTSSSHAQMCTQTHTEWSKCNYREPQGSI